MYKRQEKGWSLVGIFQIRIQKNIEYWHLKELTVDKTKIAVQLFDKFATQYAEKYMDIAKYEASLDFICNALSEGQTSILELACGPGNITHYLLQKRPDWHILATDLAPEMIKIGKKHNPAADFQLLDCRNILQLKQNYDAIICGFGFPYLSKKEAIQWIADAASLLNPAGYLYISTMEDDYELSGWEGPSTGEADRIYMHYHQADYLTWAMEANQLTISHLERIEFKKNNGSIGQDLIIIAKKEGKQ